MNNREAEYISISRVGSGEIFRESGQGVSLLSLSLSICLFSFFLYIYTRAARYFIYWIARERKGECSRQPNGDPIKFNLEERLFLSTVHAYIYIVCRSRSLAFPIDYNARFAL